MSFDYQLLQMQDQQAAIEFALMSRRLLFPEIYRKDEIPRDIQHFQQYYIESDLGCFIMVKDQGQMIGTVAYRAYDGRFKLDIPAHSVEVVKLFVLPAYRRQGIASKLCKMLFDYAQTQGIGHFYLHTHPFLPAAELFWQLQGFHTLQVETIQHYQTIHMLKSV